MNTGIIFDVKRYAIHDGPGIRTTVFFKGCPLHCPWCHNPEGIRSEPEFIVRRERCSRTCDLCVKACTLGAITKHEETVTIDEEKCNQCGDCVDSCVYEALEITGRAVTVLDLIDEVEKDIAYYDESGGGVTLSGGEPLGQYDFLCCLLDALKERGLRIALDTSGCVPFEELDRASRMLDLFLYDVKMMDPEKHKIHTGVSNDSILDNLRRLDELSKPIVIRMPIVPGINDDHQNIVETIAYLKALKNVIGVNVLPYHKGGVEKLRRLGIDQPRPTFRTLSSDAVRDICEALSETRFPVKTGG